MGLLARSENLLNTLREQAKLGIGPDFFSCAKESALSQIALLVHVNGFYCIQASFGFSCETITRSVFPKKLWRKFFPKTTEWKIYSGRKLNRWKKFFSAADIAAKKELLIKRIEVPNHDDVMCIALHNENMVLPIDNMLKKTLPACIRIPERKNSKIQISAFSENKKNNLFTIDFSYAFNLHINKFKKYPPELVQAISNAVYVSAFKLCTSFFDSPNLCLSASNSGARILLISAINISEDIFAFQLQSMLEDFFGKKESADIFVHKTEDFISLSS
ncbi:MAG: hypothetical protein Ta2A_22580 [Treponemataceae bacterium]|nr:MAG: hypothetical protein Ta2A_22580 [Treponemataceae bacterium]